MHENRKNFTIYHKFNDTQFENNITHSLDNVFDQEFKYGKKKCDYARFGKGNKFI